MRPFIAVLLAAWALAQGSTSHAAVLICTTPNCAPTDENVLVDKVSNASVVTGTTNNTGVGVTFTSPVGELLNGGANGQARVDPADGILNGLKFVLNGGATFTSAVFNLEAAPGNQAGEATSVLINYVLNNVTHSVPFTIDTNGSAWFGISGDAGERFTSVGFTGNPNTTGVGDFRQLRLGGVTLAAAVPEPSTWALMLLGVGAVGFVLRRRTAQALAGQTA